MIGQLDKLSARERRVLDARLLADKPMTLEELAMELGIARARVRQLEDRVIEKLGDTLNDLKVAHRQSRQADSS